MSAPITKAQGLAVLGVTCAAMGALYLDFRAGLADDRTKMLDQLDTMTTQALRNGLKWDQGLAELSNEFAWRLTSTPWHLRDQGNKTAGEIVGGFLSGELTGRQARERLSGLACVQFLLEPETRQLGQIIMESYQGNPDLPASGRKLHFLLLLEEICPEIRLPSARCTELLEGEISRVIGDLASSLLKPEERHFCFEQLHHAWGLGIARPTIARFVPFLVKPGIMESGILPAEGKLAKAVACYIPEG